MAANRVVVKRKPRWTSRFECLPSNMITDHILPRLPLPEAVRTSLLSRQWRHRWRYIPRLEFSSAAFPLHGDYAEEEEDEDDDHPIVLHRNVVKAVDRTLLLHVGHIREFVLSYAVEGCPDVDPWIWVLTRKDVQRIVLNFPVGGEEYVLPSCLFHCTALNCLELSCCRLRLPPFFKGFRDLAVLVLRYVVCNGDELQRLISGCPLLKDLTLEFNQGCDELRVCAPSLRRRGVKGSFRHLVVENALLLEYARLHLHIIPNFGGPGVEESADNFFRLLPSLACIRQLEIGAASLKFMSMGNIPERLPVLLCHLKAVSMDITLRNLKQNMVALCLLKSCPALEILKVHQCDILQDLDVNISDCWEAREGLDCSFNQLRIVVLTKISDGSPEMAFVKFMLANAPILQKLDIKLSRRVSVVPFRYKMVTKDLLSFPRASKQASILLRD